MSQEKVLRTLSNLGLTRLDSKIYIYLAKKGPKKGKDISKALKVQRPQLYRSLKNLQNKAIVSVSIERPALFSAIPFEKVLDLFINSKLEEAKNIQAEKKKLISSWEAIQVGVTQSSSSSFMVIEGRNIIYSRIKQMINETKNQLSIISPVDSLVRFDRFGILDINLKNKFKSKIQFRVLTQLSLQKVEIMKALIKEFPRTEFCFEIKNPNLELRLFPQMIIRDEEEAMFFINPNVEDLESRQDDLCLWTNCPSLTISFLAMFEDLWQNSRDIERAITRIEIGRPTPETEIIRDPVYSKEKFDKIIQSAKKEILLLISSKGLIDLKNIIFFEKLARSLSIRIMAPIVRQNWKTMKEFSQFCKIRHVPMHYWGTIIVDRKRLFQFKTFPAENSFSLFEETIYSEDAKWVAIMETAMNDIWNSAQDPSYATLESIIGPYGYPIFPLPKKDLRSKLDFKVIDFKTPGTITEKEVLDQIIHAKKIYAEDPSKEISRSFSSFAVAVINPPDVFNLPKFLINASKNDKKSSFGEADVITIYLWLETPRGDAYVPVVVVTDNPDVKPLLKMVCAGTPAGFNIQVVKKDALDVRVHGNTLVAGWAVPLPLYPSHRILPPGCLLIEGYGNVRPIGFTLISPSGFNIRLENNAFDAFVTFIHPDSNYSGPGTDGTFVRDSIQTIIPP